MGDGRRERVRLPVRTDIEFEDIFVWESGGDCPIGCT